MYLNKIFILGNLTRDPELKSLPSGVQVATFGLATNRFYTDKEGNKQESTEFHNVVVFGRQAETTAQYLRKGSNALVEGRLQTRSWEQDGQKRSTLDIVADRVQFLGSPAKHGTGGPEEMSEPQKETFVEEAPTDNVKPEEETPF